MMELIYNPRITGEHALTTDLELGTMNEWYSVWKGGQCRGFWRNARQVLVWFVELRGKWSKNLGGAWQESVW
jgi:hypothetical protein